ncbi:uncharacterized protein LOC127539962 [Antechinus flavipes]|uniref:uncharacterized protein LOC127539962 n=1 Tax=Antechinus flavipes TaxID=38775 RepID=UPI002235D20A|nr:uncharacterized protein LOC127539962 [Antechinus flavipes]
MRKGLNELQNGRKAEELAPGTGPPAPPCPLPLGPRGPDHPEPLLSEPEQGVFPWDLPEGRGEFRDPWNLGSCENSLSQSNLLVMLWVIKKIICKLGVSGGLQPGSEGQSGEGGFWASRIPDFPGRDPKAAAPLPLRASLGMANAASGRHARGNGQEKGLDRPARAPVPDRASLPLGRTWIQPGTCALCSEWLKINRLYWLRSVSLPPLRWTLPWGRRKSAQYRPWLEMGDPSVRPGGSACAVGAASPGPTPGLRSLCSCGSMFPLLLCFSDPACSVPCQLRNSPPVFSASALPSTNNIPFPSFAAVSSGSLNSQVHLLGVGRGLSNHPGQPPHLMDEEPGETRWSLGSLRAESPPQAAPFPSRNPESEISVWPEKNNWETPAWIGKK